jgi:hypothetical protein
MYLGTPWYLVLYKKIIYMHYLVYGEVSHSVTLYDGARYAPTDVPTRHKYHVIINLD